jgi:hypothetical protein
VLAGIETSAYCGEPLAGKVQVTLEFELTTKYTGCPVAPDGWWLATNN